MARPLSRSQPLPSDLQLAAAQVAAHFSLVTLANCHAIYLVRAVRSKVPAQFGCTLERYTEISTWVASNWRLFTLRTAQRSANPYTGALQLLELVMLGCSEQHQFKPFTSARPSTQVHHCPLLQPCRQQRNLKHRHAQASQASNGDRSPLIKICGITTLKDAKLAAAAGADFLGMIMWQKAKRAVSASTAKDIASLAGDMGIKSVGVFVDESAQQIQDACVAAGVHVAQLHGGPSREALFGLPESLQAIYVMNCNDEGRRLTPTPAELAEQTDHVCNRYCSVSCLPCV